MSADNWTTCPRCMKAARDAAAKAAKKLLADYGKISADEYARRTIAQATGARKPVDTLREDWEVGMDANGKFTVNYAASCDVCGFSFEHKESRFAVIDNTKGEQQ